MPDLRFTAVPDPPAGHDWTFTVPGQYVYHLTSISGTLSAGAAAPTTMTDSSGFGNNGAYTPYAQSFNTFGVPGLVPGDLAIRTQGGGASVGDGPITSATFTANDFFVICWTGGNTPSVPLFFAKGPSAGGTSEVDFYYDFDVIHGDCMFLDFKSGGVFVHRWTVAVAAAFPATHCWAFHYDSGADETSFWLDGAAQTITVESGAGAPGAGITDIAVFPNVTGNIVVDEWAGGIFQGTDADFPTLYTDGLAGIAGYTAHLQAIFTDHIYHLDDVGSSGPISRTVNLDITDGTNLVNEVAPPTPGTGATALQYSWLPNLQSDFTTADGSVVIVGTPDLVLGAGYTVGARTPDIGPTDRWSNVTVWWYDELAFLLISILDYHDILIIG